MNFRIHIKEFLKTPWFVALVLLGIFFSTVGYKYGWDDQHVEIPLLKSLIDDSLYQNDYYVNSLKENFTSYFYIILSKVIKVAQIPCVYLGLFILSRYFLFFWLYKLWLYISKDKLKAFFCMAVFIFVARVEEFLYRTFSHQEFALAIIFAGIYFFFRGRFFISSLLLGISTNFHALYSLFPFFYMVIYLLWDIRKYKIKILCQSICIFFLCSSPFLIWAISNHLDGGVISVNYQGWKDLYSYSCPQNFFMPLFPFSEITRNIANFFELTKEYFFLMALFILNLFLNNRFKDEKKSIAFCLGAFVLLVICFFFTYLYPNRFILDLNLVRNTQFLHFLLVGYTTLFFIDTIDHENLLIAFCASLLFPFLKFFKSFAVFPALGIIFFLMVSINMLKKPQSFKRNIGLGFFSLATGFSVYALYFLYTHAMYRYSIMVALIIIFFLNTGAYLLLGYMRERRKIVLKRIFIIIPLIVFFSHYTFYNYQRQQEETVSSGYWRLRRSWVDMQKYVKENIPKDSMIFVPHDIPMGGFRIFSERSIVFSERDCGIIGFDYAAALEWKKRYRQMNSYRATATQSFRTALDRAIFSYDAEYIVFMRYFMMPSNDFFQLAYTNMDFALYKVLKY